MYHLALVQRRHGPLPSRPRLLRLRRAGQHISPEMDFWVIQIISDTFLKVFTPPCNFLND